MEKLFVGDFDKHELLGRTVLVRVDFNVPLNEGPNPDEIVPADTSRIRASLPTIEFLIKSGAKVVLCSHLGRPRGKDPKLSMQVLVNPLKELIGECVTFVDDCVGDKVDAAKQWLKQGDVLLLENLRFHGEEKSNDAGFSKQLGSFVDVYVNDAFGSSHRGTNMLYIFLLKRCIILQSLRVQPTLPLLELLRSCLNAALDSS